MWRVLLARTSVQSQPSPLHIRGLQAALSPGRQPCSSLERRDGWRPDREADSSANSASLDRPSAVLPIVALPLNRRTGALWEESSFSGTLSTSTYYTHELLMRICNTIYVLLERISNVYRCECVAV